VGGTLNKSADSCRAEPCRAAKVAQKNKNKKLKFLKIKLIFNQTTDP